MYRASAFRVAYHFMHRGSLKHAAMSPSKFWADIAPLGWGTRSTDYKKMKKHLMKVWDKAEADAAGDTFSRLKGQLSRVIDGWVRDTGKELGLGDDGYDDLISHIIGLGQREYERVLKKPSLAYDLAVSGKFKESFAYVMPWKADYEKKEKGLKSYQDWAKESMAGYQKALRNPVYKPLTRGIQYMIDVLSKLVLADLPGFLEAEPEARKMSEKLEQEGSTLFRRSLPPNAFVMRDGSDPMANKWTVWNLYSDIHDEYLD